jgi:hypothetical protein
LARALLHAALLESALAQGLPHAAAQLLLARALALQLPARGRERVQEVLVLVPLAHQR